LLKRIGHFTPSELLKSSPPDQQVDGRVEGENAPGVGLQDNRARSAVVSIASGSSTLSGFLVTDGGHVLTADYVANGKEPFTVSLANGETELGPLVALDREIGLALLKIELLGRTEADHLLPLQLAESIEGVNDVILWGSPRPGTSEVRNGNITGRSGSYLSVFFQGGATSGFGGGPVIDGRGSVVGILYSTTLGNEKSQYPAKCVSSDVAKSFVDRTLRSEADHSTESSATHFRAEPVPLDTPEVKKRSPSQPPTLTASPSYWVLVAGTGKPSVSFPVRLAAQVVGEVVAKQGMGLITGGWEG
jgi:hypothetical protein